MRRPGKKRHNRCFGLVLAAAAFLGAVMCMSFFSVKFMLITLAVLLIVLGIFLLRL